MTTVRPFAASDLFHFNNVNMDHWTETYSNGFYLNYLAQWPDMMLTACAAHSGKMMGYVLGKTEGRAPKGRASAELTLHGHVTAVTVAPEFRRLGVAQMLMDFFELVSERVYDAYFVDLFVRPSNAKAIQMYEKRGYSVYRRVHAYYRGGSNDMLEDGLGTLCADADMRKPLPRDVQRQTVRKNGHRVVVRPEYVCVVDAERPFSHPWYAPVYRCASSTARSRDTMHCTAAIYLGGWYGSTRYLESDSSLAGPRTSSVRSGIFTMLKSSAYRSSISATYLSCIALRTRQCSHVEPGGG